MNTDNVLNGMKMVVLWEDMRDLCQGRSQCDSDEQQGIEKCPYRSGKSCDMISTEKVLKTASGVFREYLSEVEVL